ncbi:MAG: hypothetical protein LBG48_06025 [Rickettsiales bacterium]|jgi:hypothetical protein|nr:hypothetical protein [Rickettsiales bacterium]
MTDTVNKNPRRYELNLLKDLMNVPEEKLDECLKCLKKQVLLWNKMERKSKINPLFNMISSIEKTFVWIDDGDNCIKVPENFIKIHTELKDKILNEEILNDMPEIKSNFEDFFETMGDLFLNNEE